MFPLPGNKRNTLALFLILIIGKLLLTISTREKALWEKVEMFTSPFQTIVEHSNVIQELE